MRSLLQSRIVLAAVVGVIWCGQVQGATTVTHPYQGITSITRTETSPRAENMHIVLVDLTAPGISFELTGKSGTYDTTRQTTLNFINQKQAQVAINSHFYVAPTGAPAGQVQIVGLAASKGTIISPFEPQPVAAGLTDQSYAIMPFAAALNIDASNNAGIVHRDPAYADNMHILESATIYNAVAGSAQIITNGAKTIPTYTGTANGGLNTGAGYSDADSWYNRVRSRTAIGLTADKKTLVLFTVDEINNSGSTGMKIGEVADILMSDYGVYNALNLDGGGSTTLAMQNPSTLVRSVVNAPSDNSGAGGIGRDVGSSLAIYAVVPEPSEITLMLILGVFGVLSFRSPGRGGSRA